jgi:hypothetical protein
LRGDAVRGEDVGAAAQEGGDGGAVGDPGVVAAALFVGIGVGHDAPGELGVVQALQGAALLFDLEELQVRDREGLGPEAGAQGLEAARDGVERFAVESGEDALLEGRSGLEPGGLGGRCWPLVGAAGEERPER